ncbi:MAG: multicomponent Na+:H+ antiporter subunit [Bacillota bacterium]|nr:multicomponent Na+:H+ antiporter subunit [Bacillota bacterium]
MLQGSLLVLPLLGEGLRWQCDALSLLFVLLTLWVGLWAVLYSFPYLAHSHARPRFYLCWFLTLTGCVGSFLAADLFTLYLFFELMSLASWALVVHEEDYPALRAGNTYLYLSLAGGLCLLAAAVLLQTATGTSAWGRLAFLPPPPFTTQRLVALLLTTGFGLKAGLFPLHFWLPQAHPVAPAPASALLSGILLKVGAYGLLRTMSLLARWRFPALAALGTLLAGLAVLTMLLGAHAALRQPNVKRLLAFSSVSQLGYVVLGIALAALLAPVFPLAWPAALYHALNHALAKAGLFLSAGALGHLTGSLDCTAASGLAWRYRGLGVSVTLGAAAMTGLPGLSGYISKTLLHHTVVATAGSRTAAWRLLEPVFLLASAGTVAYYLVFLLPWIQKARSGPSPAPQKAPLLLWLPPFILTLSTVAVGLLPHVFLVRLIVPAAVDLLGEEEAPHLAAELAHFHPWSGPDLKGALLVVLLGLVVYAAYRRGLLPSWRPAHYYMPWAPLARLLQHLADSGKRSASTLAGRTRAALAALLVPLLARLAGRGGTDPGEYKSDPLALLLTVLTSLGAELQSAEEGMDSSYTHIARRAVQRAPFPSADYFLSLAEGLLLVTCHVLRGLDALLNQGGAALAHGIPHLFQAAAHLDEALENLSTSGARAVHAFLCRLGRLEAPPRPADKVLPPPARWEELLHLDLLNLDVAVLILALLLVLTLLYFLLQA